MFRFYFGFCLVFRVFRFYFGFCLMFRGNVFKTLKGLFRDNGFQINLGYV